MWKSKKVRKSRLRILARGIPIIPYITERGGVNHVTELLVSRPVSKWTAVTKSVLAWVKDIHTPLECHLGDNDCEQKRKAWNAITHGE
jgi:hypothetical protein